MEDLTQIKLDINDHKNKIGSLEHRMYDQEKQTNTISELVISVKELAINMKNMLDEQKAQNERIQKLEDKPVQTMNLITSSMITTIIGGIIGYVISLLL